MSSSSSSSSFLFSSVARSGGTKENDGRQHRKRFINRVVVSLCISIVTYHFLWNYWLAGVFVPEYENDPTTGRKKIRRRPDLLQKEDILTHKKVPTTPFDGVMEGYLTLIDLVLPNDGLLLKDDGSNGYDGVKGIFCHISWERQQSNPSAVPLFSDLKQQSPLCASTTITIEIDLYTLTQQAHQYDQNTHNFTVTSARAGHQVSRPTAVVFHESKSGSTLVSNMLAASDPPRMRSFSEAAPPLKALQACEDLVRKGKFCDENAQTQLIKDVFYLMGRITRPAKPQFVFYKMQPVAVRYLPLFTKAMPDIPWVFLFRNSVEILMSHFTNYQKGQSVAPMETHPTCLLDYGMKKQHPLMQEVMDYYTNERTLAKNISSLTREQYCALYVSTLGHAAVSEYNRIVPPVHKQTKNWKHNRLQFFYNYDRLPHIIWDDWISRLHMGYINPDMKDRMQQVANEYSHSRRPPGGGQDSARQWHEDTTMKQARAPQSLKDAATLFLDGIYQKMMDIQSLQDD